MQGERCKTVIDAVLEDGQPIALFAGAGVSVDLPTGLPTAYDLMAEVLLCVYQPSGSCCDSGLARGEIDEILRRIRFEQLIEVLRRCCDPHLDILDVFLLPDRPNANHMLLAAMLLLGHAVVTTNLDNMIESAIVLCGATCKPIYDEPGFRSACGGLPKNALLKLHGTVAGAGPEGKRSVRAAATDVASDGYGLELRRHKRALLTALLSQLNLVVIGYSGCDDYDMVPLMGSVWTSRSLLWIDHQDERDRARSLSQLRAQDDNSRARRVLELACESRAEESCWLLECDTGLVREALAAKYVGTQPPRPDGTSGAGEGNGWRDLLQHWAASHAGDHEARLLVQAEVLHESGLRDKAVPLFKGLLGSPNASVAEFAAAHLRHHPSSPVGIMYTRDAPGSNGQAAVADDVLATTERAHRLSLAGEEGQAEQLFLSVLPHLLHPAPRATVLGYVADIRIRRGEFTAALALLEQSLAITREAGDPHEESRTLWRYANCLIRAGKYEDALGCLEKSLRTLRWLNRVEDVSRILGAIGMARHCLGKFDEAVKAYTDSLRQKEKLHDYHGIGVTYHNLARLRLDNNQPAEALQDCLASLQMGQKVGDTRGEAEVSLLAADILCRMGEKERALSFLHKAERISERLHDGVLSKRIQE